MSRTLPVSRRGLIQALGALVVSLGSPVNAQTLAAVGAASDAKPPLLPNELDTFIAVGADGRVTAFVGKVDMGQGAKTALAQMAADELDVPVGWVTVAMGDTGTSVDQGGASGSSNIELGGKQLRFAAAEARRVLLERAAQRLGAPVASLTVADGEVSAGGKSLTYGELVSGRYFNLRLDWNGQYGNPLQAHGKAKPKTPDQYRIVGRSVARSDVAPIVMGHADYVTDLKIPGMVHARLIRPPVAGAVPVSVDEGSMAGIPGARVVRRKDFIAVVAPREWDAIKASKALKVTWTDAGPPFPTSEALYDHLRTAPATEHQAEVKVGDVDAVFAGAAKIVEAEYEWPFQSHSSMGPACALAQIVDGKATVWTGTQKPHAAREGVAAILGMKPSDVRVIWTMGPGSYGRNDAGDTALACAVLAQAVGKPVRLQGMRHEGHGWDPKGPASIHRGRAALDQDGGVVAYDFFSKGFSRRETFFTEAKPNNTMVGQLLGWAPDPANVFGVPGDTYAFPNKRAAWETVAPLLAKHSPLRTSHLRDPAGPQIHFASESFMDEMAHAAGADPVAFRLRYIADPRAAAVLKAVAARVKWTARRGASDRTGPVLKGRGVACGTRAETQCAIVADIEVDRATGRIWARRMTVAHDCGQVINPRGLTSVVEGNVVHALSRTLCEAVTFDHAMVTSVDWATYPILDIMDVPETIDVVILDQPNIAPTGAGEASSRPVAAAVANAFFDATGVRMRRAPFTREAVLRALA